MIKEYKDINDEVVNEIYDNIPKVCCLLKCRHRDYECFMCCKKMGKHTSYKTTIKEYFLERYCVYYDRINILRKLIS